MRSELRILSSVLASLTRIYLLEEADDFVVGQEVHSCLWQQGSILALVALVQLHLVLLLLADGLVAAHGWLTDWVCVGLGVADGRELGWSALLNVLHHKHEFLLGDFTVVVWVQLQDEFVNW
jgi:hypothetical protein